jgi:hypothetical protein
MGQIRFKELWFSLLKLIRHKVWIRLPGQNENGLFDMFGISGKREG